MRKRVSNFVSSARVGWIALLLSIGSAVLIAAQASLLLGLTVLGGMLAWSSLVLDRQRLRLLFAPSLRSDRSNRSHVQHMSAHKARLTDRVVSRAIRRTHPTDRSDRSTQILPFTAAPAVTERTVAVLCVGLRTTAEEAFGARAVQQMLQVALDAQRILRDDAQLITLQADGTLLITFGAECDRPVAASLGHALTVATDLHQLHLDVRFGLSCGVGTLCSLTGQPPTVIGAPAADAARLFRMAAAWHEYHLLCTEPVALVSQAAATQRTSLALTHATLPALPVYAVELAQLPAAAIA